MGWNIIRKATEFDEQALQAAAERFCKRHNLEFDNDMPAQTTIDYTLDHDREDENAKRLRPLWRAIVRRTLGRKSAEGIAYGYVGYSQD